MAGKRLIPEGGKAALYAEGRTGTVEQARGVEALVWLSMRGMLPRPERIAITAGAHPAIMGALGVLAGPGDTIACEAITYPGIRRICKHLQLNLVGIAFDDDGILPDALSEVIATQAPKALYLNPTLNNPTTRTMTPERRIAIADILQRHKLPLIENDAYGFVPARAPAPMATIIPDLTGHIGGLAKCIGAGLRLAYVVLPDSRQALSLEQAIKTTSVTASPVTMAIVTRWITDGTADRIRRFVRKEAAVRQKIAAKSLPHATFASAGPSRAMHCTKSSNFRGIRLTMASGRTDRAELTQRLRDTGSGSPVAFFCSGAEEAVPQMAAASRPATGEIIVPVFAR